MTRTNSNRITIDLTDEQRRRVRVLCGALDFTYRELWVRALDALEADPDIIAKLEREARRTRWGDPEA